MSEAEREPVGVCPGCGTTIWNDHPYSWCSKCGNGLPDEIKSQLQLPRAPERGDALVVEGRTIACPICDHNRFWTRKTLMDTRGTAFFGIDWTNPSAENYICLRCGHVLWFLRP